MNDPSSSVLRIPGKVPVRVYAGAGLAVVLWLMALLTGRRELLLFAPVASVFTLLSLRRISRPRHLRLGPEGLTVEETGQRVALEDMEAVITRPRKQTHEGIPPAGVDAVLWHHGGELLLPRQAERRTGWLGELRRLQSALDPARVLSGELRRFHQAESAVYGEDAVFTARILSRHLTVPRRTNGGVVDLLLALVLGGMVFGVCFPGRGNKDGNALAGTLAGMGGMLAFFTGLAALSRRSAVKQFAGSGIVISPGGLALQYGLLKGVLRWEELQSFRFAERRAVSALRLQVPGSTILLGDFFDRPLAQIHSMLREYAGPPS
jgi:hypothetical protein